MPEKNMKERSYPVSRLARSAAVQPVFPLGDRGRVRCIAAHRDSPQQSCPVIFATLPYFILSNVMMLISRVNNPFGLNAPPIFLRGRGNVYILLLLFLGGYDSMGG
jgi:hypothetical protein